jgi:hypothetical protein
MFANATNNKTRQKYKEFDNNRMKGKKWRPEATTANNEAQDF